MLGVGRSTPTGTSWSVRKAAEMLLVDAIWGKAVMVKVEIAGGLGFQKAAAKYQYQENLIDD